MNTFLLIVLCIAAWYLLGVVSSVVYTMQVSRVITLKDAVELASVSILGPILAIVLMFDVMIESEWWQIKRDWWRNNRDKALWKKQKKSK